MQQHPFFLTGPSILFSNSRSRMIGRWISAMIIWLSALLLAAVILFYPESPAWGSGIHLRADQHKIQGYTHRAPLGDILSKLSRRVGFANTALKDVGGACFISAPASELSGVAVLILLCILSAMYGIRLLLHTRGAGTGRDPTAHPCSGAGQRINHSASTIRPSCSGSRT